MRSACAAGAAAAALAVCATAQAARAQGRFELQPFQMVRSLELVQDRLAAGDEAAMPMQRKILEMIDHRLRIAKSDEFENERNFKALLVYAMSGGNPATVDAVISRIKLGPADAQLGAGVLGYLEGQPRVARDALKDVDPMAEPPELGAFLALVKASVTAPEDPAAAVALLDQARLLAPGTLVEEAALRRTILIASSMKDTRRFLEASERYVRRFLTSPYASQFADAFVSGVVDLHNSLDMDAVAATISEMDSDRRKFIYLRLARRSAIQGVGELAAFASAKAEMQTPGDPADPRAVLYSGIAAITSDDVEETASRLKAIDRSRLSPSDRELLDAAVAVAAEVTARPKAPPPPSGKTGAAPRQSSQKAEKTEARAAPGGGPSGAAQGEAPAPQVAAAPATLAAKQNTAGLTATVDKARQTLAAIDKMLTENTE